MSRGLLYMHNKDNMTIFLADYSPVVEACKSLEGMREMVQLRTKHLTAFHAIWWQISIQSWRILWLCRELWWRWRGRIRTNFQAASQTWILKNVSETCLFQCSHNWSFVSQFVIVAHECNLELQCWMLAVIFLLQNSLAVHQAEIFPS